MSEVIGGGTLAEAIASGAVLEPPLVNYQSWISWRAGEGLRPTMKKSGHSTTSRQEAELWKTTMEARYGTDWRSLLEDAELLRAEEAEAAAQREAELRRDAAPTGVEEGTVPGAGSEELPKASPSEGGGQPEPGRRREDTASVGSSAPPTPRALRRLLDAKFEPDKESYAEYEGRVNRMVVAMNSLGIPLEEAEVAYILMRAKYIRDLAALPAESRRRQVKEWFALCLVDERTSRGEIEARLEILRDLLEEHGGRLSLAADKLFSSVHTTPQKGSFPDTVKDEGIGPTTPVHRGQKRETQEPDEDREALRKKLFESQKRVRDLEKHLNSPPRSEHSEQGGDVAQTLADALKGQTEALKAMLSTTHEKRKRSTIQVSPKVLWPTLNDSCTDHRSVEEFYQTFESTVQLANDGEGMSDLEMLTTLKACLKEHRLKSYELIYKRAHAAGTLKDNPGKVYQEIKTKHLLFAETREEREIRVLEEGDRLEKGKLTAYQFETLWEEHLSERAEVGLGCTAREYLLQYYRKIGPTLAKEVRKDKRFRPDGSGSGKEVFRGVATWEEAHEVVKEIEAMTAGQKAISNATFSSTSAGANAGRNQRRGRNGDGRIGRSAYWLSPAEQEAVRLLQDAGYRFVSAWKRLSLLSRLEVSRGS